MDLMCGHAFWDYTKCLVFDLSRYKSVFNKKSSKEPQYEVVF